MVLNNDDLKKNHPNVNYKCQDKFLSQYCKYKQFILINTIERKTSKSNSDISCY